VNSFKKKLNNTAEKVAGEAKEAVGKITGNEQLELKGKIQSAKADFKKKMDVGDRVDNFKENIARNINDKMDRKEKN
jgi:uncharacterized protein YjbJ (UPF0337 family)